MLAIVGVAVVAGPSAEATLLPNMFAAPLEPPKPDAPPVFAAAVPVTLVVALLLAGNRIVPAGFGAKLPKTLLLDADGWRPNAVLPNPPTKLVPPVPSVDLAPLLLEAGKAVVVEALAPKMLVGAAPKAEEEEGWAVVEGAPKVEEEGSRAVVSAAEDEETAELCA